MTDAKDRELELIDGMIEVQLHHARQCDAIANRTMAEKQKGWDMERVALLRKMRAALAQKAEPVAYVLQSTHDASIMFDKIAVCGWHNFEKKLDELKADAWVSKGRADIVPLYAAPPAPAAVPPGYALVPIEPTLAMVIAGENCIGRHAWAKMIAAAGEKP